MDNNQTRQNNFCLSTTYMGKPVGSRFGQMISAGLVNFDSESRLPFVQTSSTHRNYGLEGPKLEQSLRKNRTTFQMFRCFLGKQLLNYKWNFFRQLPALIGYFSVTWHLACKTVDAFHSTKPFEIWKQEQAVQKFSGKSFQKFTKLLNFRNVNHSTENSTNFRESKVEWKENFWQKIFENLGIIHEVVLFFGNCGKCRLIRYCELNENLNRTFWLNGKYPLFFSSNTAFQGVKHTTFLWSPRLAWLLARSLPTQKYEQVSINGRYCI